MTMTYSFILFRLLVLSNLFNYLTKTHQGNYFLCFLKLKTSKVQLNTHYDNTKRSGCRKYGRPGNDEETQCGLTRITGTSGPGPSPPTSDAIGEEIQNQDSAPDCDTEVTKNLGK